MGNMPLPMGPIAMGMWSLVVGPVVVLRAPAPDSNRGPLRPVSRTGRAGTAHLCGHGEAPAVREGPPGLR